MTPTADPHPHRRRRLAAPERPFAPLDTPVSALGLPPRTVAVLEALGAVYVRNLVNLPRARLTGTGRLSADGVAQVRQAVIRTGAVPPADWYRPPAVKIGGLF